MSDDQPLARDRFMFFSSYRDAIADLPDPADQLATFWAIVNYGLDGVEPEKGIARAIFRGIKPAIDNSRKLSKVRTETGKLGGRPKNQTETKPKPNENQTITKPKPNHKQTETVEESRVEESRVVESSGVESRVEEVASGDAVKKETIKEKTPDKKVAYAEFVTMTKTEHTKLARKHGKACADWCIEKLNAFKGSTGKRYKSDYLAICNWVLSRYRQEHPQLETVNLKLTYPKAFAFWESVRSVYPSTHRQAPDERALAKIEAEKTYLQEQAVCQACVTFQQKDYDWKHGKIPMMWQFIAKELWKNDPKPDPEPQVRIIQTIHTSKPPQDKPSNYDDLPL